MGAGKALGIGYGGKIVKKMVVVTGGGRVLTNTEHCTFKQAVEMVIRRLEVLLDTVAYIRVVDTEEDRALEIAPSYETSEQRRKLNEILLSRATILDTTLDKE